MSDYIEITVIVEGHTEQKFVRDILAPYLGEKGIFMTPVLISKPGQKGGDVRFARAINDIGKHLKQRNKTFVSLLVDYYGIGRDWPGLDSAKKQTTPENIAWAINSATNKAVNIELSAYRSDYRFIPNITVHEFEALLFSDTEKLAEHLKVKHQSIKDILTECGEPENINDSSQTAPSKRLESLYRRYKKTTTGIAVARAIGIDKMREQCPIFNGWLTKIEFLRRGNYGKA